MSDLEYHARIIADRALELPAEVHSTALHLLALARRGACQDRLLLIACAAEVACGLVATSDNYAQTEHVREVVARSAVAMARAIIAEVDESAR